MRRVILALVPFLIAAAPGGSVKVRVLRLEGSPASLHGCPLAVRVYIGGVHIYTTPYVVGEVPQWNKSLRASTLTNSSIVFEVLREVQAAEANDALSTGFDELVGDYADRPEGPKKTEHAVVCRVELAWLPRDGEHRLACGGMVLVVRTARLR